MPATASHGTHKITVLLPCSFAVAASSGEGVPTSQATENTMTKNRVVYDVAPNTPNDKKAKGSYKITVREFDAEGRMTRAQTYAQEIYNETHARFIASSLNVNCATTGLLAAAREVLDTVNDGPADNECPISGRMKMTCDCVAHGMLKRAIEKTGDI